MRFEASDVKVSVCVVTYNQAAYIEKCLLSLVDQQANFNFEVIVGDDASTDGTSAIVLELAERYPNIIKAFVHPQNIGVTNNYLYVHGRACGKYIAHMDGDDYALPGKLQAQSDFLDQNQNYNIVWHRMLIENPTVGIVVEDLVDSSIFNDSFTRNHIFRYITIGMHSSKMYRSSVRKVALPNFLLLDYYLNVEQIGDGLAGFVGGEPLGVYRTGIGIASSGNKTKVLLMQAFDHFLNKYKGSASEISVAVSIMTLAALKNGRFADVRIFLPVLIRSFRLSTIPKILQNVKMFAMLRIPDSVKNK
ncbi:glycosyltransferase family 2 protein [Pseudomonas sp. EA_15y_Pfl1_P104]|uniref:glycosyltransferase family 2 protein n=1 Tax=Pseudomonas sp. EA_15y_Pfl1_P104 TaxID=3088686 RepID=UPI0030DD0EAA